SPVPCTRSGCRPGLVSGAGAFAVRSWDTLSARERAPQPRPGPTTGAALRTPGTCNPSAGLAIQPPVARHLTCPAWRGVDENRAFCRIAELSRNRSAHEYSGDIPRAGGALPGHLPPFDERLRSFVATTKGDAPMADFLAEADWKAVLNKPKNLGLRAQGTGVSEKLRA